MIASEDGGKGMSSDRGLQLYLTCYILMQSYGVCQWSLRYMLLIVSDIVLSQIYSLEFSIYHFQVYFIYNNTVFFEYFQALYMRNYQVLCSLLLPIFCLIFLRFVHIDICNLHLCINMPFYKENTIEVSFLLLMDIQIVSYFLLVKHCYNNSNTQLLMHNAKNIQRWTWQSLRHIRLSVC